MPAMETLRLLGRPAVLLAALVPDWFHAGVRPVKVHSNLVRLEKLRRWVRALGMGDFKVPVATLWQ